MSQSVILKKKKKIVPGLTHMLYCINLTGFIYEKAEANYAKVELALFPEGRVVKGKHGAMNLVSRGS